MQVILQELVTTQGWNNKSKILDERPHGAGTQILRHSHHPAVVGISKCTQADSENMGKCTRKPAVAPRTAGGCQGEGLCCDAGAEIRDNRKEQIPSPSCSRQPLSGIPGAKPNRQPAGKAEMWFAEFRAQLTAWSIKAYWKLSNNSLINWHPEDSTRENCAGHF